MDVLFSMFGDAWGASFALSDYKDLPSAVGAAQRRLAGQPGIDHVELWCGGRKVCELGRGCCDHGCARAKGVPGAALCPLATAPVKEPAAA